MKNEKHVNLSYITIQELNLVMRQVQESDNIIVKYHYEDCFKYDNHNYLIILITTVYFFYYDQFQKKRKYYFSRIDTDDYERIYTTGSNCYKILKRHYIKEDININLEELGVKDYDELGTSSAEMFYSQKYNHKEVCAYEYDINSAFSYSAIQYEQPVQWLRNNDVIRNDNEIGFILDEDGKLQINESHYFESRWIFQKGKINGFDKFFKEYYEKKKKAKTKKERSYYKDILNMTVGYFQLINPFIRASIINRLNQEMYERIEKYKDCIIYSNTDSIVSLKDLSKELDIGEEIGQFKIEKENKKFYISGYNYQWEDSLPTYRGIPKSWFKNWETLNNKEFKLSSQKVTILTKLLNNYYFDYKDFQFYKRRLNYEDIKTSPISI